VRIEVFPMPQNRHCRATIAGKVNGSRPKFQTNDGRAVEIRAKGGIRSDEEERKWED